MEFGLKLGQNLGVILKNPLIINWARGHVEQEVKNLDMITKTKALVLLSIVVVATVAGVMVFAMQPTVNADASNQVADEIESTPTLSAINATDNSLFGLGGFGGPMMIAMEPRFGFGHRGMERGFVGFDAIQVSSDFTANVTNIAQSDSDVQNLLTQGYNITSIHPVISTTIDANGNVVTKASTADLTLLGNNGSRALVVVDLTQAKVTKIVTVAVTEIDK
jgi:hypothetical protein